MSSNATQVSSTPTAGLAAAGRALGSGERTSADQLSTISGSSFAGITQEWLGSRDGQADTDAGAGRQNRSFSTPLMTRLAASFSAVLEQFESEDTLPFADWRLHGIGIYQRNLRLSLGMSDYKGYVLSVVS